jgi:hypothetical protein
MLLSELISKLEKLQEKTAIVIYVLRYKIITQLMGKKWISI